MSAAAAGLTLDRVPGDVARAEVEVQILPDPQVDALRKLVVFNPEDLEHCKPKRPPVCVERFNFLTAVKVPPFVNDSKANATCCPGFKDPSLSQGTEEIPRMEPRKCLLSVKHNPHNLIFQKKCNACS